MPDYTPTYSWANDEQLEELLADYRRMGGHHERVAELRAEKKRRKAQPAAADLQNTTDYPDHSLPILMAAYKDVPDKQLFVKALRDEHNRRQLIKLTDAQLDFGIYSRTNRVNSSWHPDTPEYQTAYTGQVAPLVVEKDRRKHERREAERVDTSKQAEVDVKSPSPTSQDSAQSFSEPVTALSDEQLRAFIAEYESALLSLSLYRDLEAVRSTLAVLTAERGRRIEAKAAQKLREMPLETVERRLAAYKRNRAQSDDPALIARYDRFLAPYEAELARRRRERLLFMGPAGTVSPAKHDDSWKLMGVTKDTFVDPQLNIEETIVYKGKYPFKYSPTALGWTPDTNVSFDWANIPPVTVEFTGVDIELMKLMLGEDMDTKVSFVEKKYRYTIVEFFKDLWNDTFVYRIWKK
jgi:hypothetical protein